MSTLSQTNTNNLRAKIRAFEDRKISAADLGREVFHQARALQGDSESGLRRALERHGNRINALIERGPANQTHSEILAVVDDIIAVLPD